MHRKNSHWCSELKPGDMKEKEAKPVESATSKPDMPPPPSPASSTCSDHSSHSIRSPGGSLSKSELITYPTFNLCLN